MVKREFVCEYGSIYEHYQGAVWVTKIKPDQETQGMNIAIKAPHHANNKLTVIGYVIRNGEHYAFNGRNDCDLDEVVKQLLYGNWTEAYCNRLLNEEY